MIAVQRSLGRLVVVAASHPVSKLDALRLQQDLSMMLRRMGEPAILVCDFRDVPALEPDAGHMLSLMLASSASLARRRVVLGADPDTFASAFVDAHHGWLAVADSGELQSALSGIGTPAEQHAAHELFSRRQAA